MTRIVQALYRAIVRELRSDPLWLANMAREARPRRAPQRNWPAEYAQRRASARSLRFGPVWEILQRRKAQRGAGK